MVKKLVKSVLPYKLRVKIMRGKNELRRILRRRKKISSIYPLTILKKSGYNTYFGYYDINPFNSHGSILYIRTKTTGKADIIIRNFESKEEIIVASTNTWNWQQGCRLRWVPGSDNLIMFNDCINQHYVTRILNTQTREERRIEVPLYDISHNGKLGLSINFSLLGLMRPDYGYTILPYRPLADIGSQEGIFLVDIEKGTSRLILSYKEISKALGEDKDSYENNYINHLSFSPDDKSFLFFWLEVVDGWHRANLLVYLLETGELKVLETQRKVSHYTWDGIDKIICSSINNDKSNLDPHYIEYDFEGNKKILYPEILNKDGHPTMIESNLMMTDTYPDSNQFQHLFMLNMESGNVENLVDVYHVNLALGEKVESRTDLHPRYNEKTRQICFDMNTNGNRSIGILDLNK